jgi:uncharacterized protein YaaR (DUF327 family)
VNTLVEYTAQVEQECPVGKYFGVIGTGEGIVWIPESNEYRHAFKVKGEKHSISKVKKLTSVDTEKFEQIAEMAQSFVTETRCGQMVEKMKLDGIELVKTNVGQFLKRMNEDIIKEELDTIVDNGFTVKEVMSQVANYSREWFFEKFC